MGQGEQSPSLKAYPDFDIEAVNRYARAKGVRWIGHMETWGQAHIIENEMDSLCLVPPHGVNVC
jgi:alpha-glucosidase